MPWSQVAPPPPVPDDFIRPCLEPLGGTRGKGPGILKGPYATTWVYGLRMVMGLLEWLHRYTRTLYGL